MILICLLIGICTSVLIFAIILQIKKIIRNREIISESTDLHRGTRSERNVILTLRKFGIHPKAIFHDLYFKTNNDCYVQVDMVVPTKVGIIVFEMKDYSGWLFGNGNQKKWTQLLNYGRDRYYFYNPIMQNSGHIKHIQKLCPQLERVPIYSVIVFSGSCILKNVSNIPEDVYLIYDYQLTNTLNQIFTNPPATYTDKIEILNLLEQAKSNGANGEIVAQHIKNIRSIHGDGFGESHYRRISLLKFLLRR